MTTIDELKAQRKSELVRLMGNAEKHQRWLLLWGLARQGQQLDPEWFEAAAFLQAAMIERVGELFPNNPIVQEAVEANRLVRRLADKQGQ